MNETRPIIEYTPQPWGLLFTTSFVASLSVSALFFCCTWSEAKKMESRERLVRIYDEVTLGEDEASVAKKIIANVDRERISVRSEQYYVSSPEEFLAGGWRLSLCFVDGQLQGTYFGTGIYDSERPFGAPLPKGEMC